MAKRSSRSSDPRDFIIVLLVFLVLTEGFFLFVRTPSVSVPTKGVAVKEVKHEARNVKKQTTDQFPAISVKPPIQRETTLSPLPRASAIEGHLAIIVDDCGYSALPCQIAPSINGPVTFSVLPNLKFSTQVSRCTDRAGKEVMLHLPMEAHHNSDPYPESYLIKVNMSKSKIESIIAKSLASVPNAVGVNNHMGSKATENKSVMSIIFAALKRQGLFFVDSVTGKSVCKEIAHTMKLPFAERQVFLDNKNERTYIENQFKMAAQKARENGYAIAIGHARPLTLQIIKEQADKLPGEGVIFVTVQELIGNQ